MRKLTTLAAAVTIISAGAFAGEHTINAVGRTGWVYKDNDVKKTETVSSSSFNIDYLRTTFAGTVNPSVTYSLSVDLLGDSSSPDVVDGTSSLIDEAFITKTFSQGTSFTFGKKAVLIGGREYDYSDYDRYTNSAFYEATPETQVGATLSHEIAGQTFSAQYFNGNKVNGKQNAAEDCINTQSKYGYALAWNGDIANGLVKPIVGYTVVPEFVGSDSTETDATAAKANRTYRKNKGDDTFLSAGVQFNLPSDLTLETDYDVLTEKDASGTATAKKDLKTTSLVAILTYTSDRFSPFVKWISDESKTGSVKTGTRSAYDIGLEFKEGKDDMVRYHVVYSGSKVKTGINTTEVVSSPATIMVGLKFDAAILK